MKTPADSTAAAHGGAHGRIGDYLQRLESALELLGPDEAADTTAEIASYLAQAEAEGSLDSFLTTLGSPEALASGVLVERGLLPAPGRLPPVAAWRTVVAGVVDVLVSVAPLALALPILLLPLGLRAFDGPSRFALWLLLNGGLLVLGALIWAVHYWRSRTRGGRRQSVGMTLAGLRVVRAGAEMGLVRSGDVRGAERRGRSRVGAALRFMVAAALIGAVSYAFAYSYAQNAGGSAESDLEVVVRDAGGAAGAASAVATAVVDAVGGGSAAPPPDLLENGAEEGFTDLVRAAAENGARAYQIVWVSDARYEDLSAPVSSAASFVVDALEMGTLQRPVRFTVTKHVDVSSDGQSGVTWYRVATIDLGEAFDPGE